MRKIEIDGAILAAIINRLGGSVTIARHEAARIDARSEVVQIIEPEGAAMTLEVKVPMDYGAIDAEFRVVQ